MVNKQNTRPQILSTKRFSAHSYRSSSTECHPYPRENFGFEILKRKKATELFTEYIGLSRWAELYISVRINNPLAKPPPCGMDGVL